MSETDNIHPIFDQLIQRSDREHILGQNAKVLWLMVYRVW